MFVFRNRFLTEAMKRDELGRPLMYKAINAFHEDLDDPQVFQVVQNYFIQHPNDIPVNEKDKHGFTPLIVAAYRQAMKVVECLLKHPHIQVNIRGPSDATALYSCAQGNKAKAVEYLVCLSVDESVPENLKVDVNAQKPTGSTPLMVASKLGHTEVVRSLMRNPTISVNNTYQSNNGSALIFAAANGHLEIVKLLCGKSDLDMSVKAKDGVTALDASILYGHREVWDFLTQQQERRHIP